MPKRSIITKRHQIAAHLLVVERLSGRKALEQAGYGKSFSKQLGRALQSEGLKLAVRQEQAKVQEQLQARPKKPKRYINSKTLDSINREVYAPKMDEQTATDREQVAQKLTETFSPRCVRCQSVLNQFNTANHMGQPTGWCITCARAQQPQHYSYDEGSGGYYG